jgi:hypothetical protein
MRIANVLLLYYGTAQKSSLEKMAGWRSKVVDHLPSGK